MSIDLAHPPPHLSYQEAIAIAQAAPRFLKNTSGPAQWPWKLVAQDPPAETWDSLETLFVQCLRTGDDDSAKQILDRFISRFGEESEKVMAYQGIYEEATAKTEADVAKVMKKYTSLLQEKPENLPILKRHIALLKSAGKTAEAIIELVKLLDVSPSDAEAWAELADMYLAQGMSNQAIFCLEEVLVIQPNAWNIHAKLAEIIYASASPSIVEQARATAESMRRYLRSIELCKGYLRGYYGVKFTAAKLLELVPQATELKDKSPHYTDLELPTMGTLEALNEMATAKLAEIVRESSTGKGWNGYDEAEVQAAKDLLETPR